MLALIFWLVWREDSSPGMLQLALGHTLIVGGTLLVDARFPHLLTNTLSVVGVACLLEGVRLFYRLVSPRWLIPGAAALHLLSFPVQQDGHANARITVTMGSISLLLAATAWSA